MLKRLEVNHFKSLNDFSIDFTPLTVIIGDNAAGKSTVIQAITFLKCCCTKTIDSYLDSRGVEITDLASKFTSKKSMSFVATFDFDGEKVKWDVSFALEKANNRAYLRQESVVRESSVSSEVLLQYTPGKAFRVNEQTKETIDIAPGAYPASQISFVSAWTERNPADDPYKTLNQIRNFFEQTEPLDLLTPKEMRKSARGSVRSLGRAGERLPALINQLSEEEHQELTANLSKVLPYLDDVKSIVHGVPGWAHLETIETYHNSTKSVNIPSNGISDGVLRLIALFSLSYLQKQGGITLLDEVEDGINVSNLEVFAKLLVEYSKKQQILLTTHSTVLLDEFPPESIRYLYRNEVGSTVCRPFTHSAEVQRKLQFLYPGEVVLNTTKEELNQSMWEADYDD